MLCAGIAEAGQAEDVVIQVYWHRLQQVVCGITHATAHTLYYKTGTWHAGRASSSQ